MTVQDLMKRAVAEDRVVAISAEVHRDGQVWWAAAGPGRSPQDRFRVGSTTKSFVAAVVLQLVGEGVLGLDDPVGRWLPEAGIGTATVEQVLHHTSGIFDYLRDLETLGGYPTFTPELLVEVATARPPAFAPGTGWQYCNTGYVLAGLIVERATGRPLAEEIARRITRPLGLTGTYLPAGSDPAIAGPHARHYSKKFQPEPDAEIYDVTEMDSSMFWAAGALISTLGDLAGFFGALLGGRLLRPAEQRAMLTMIPTTDWIPGATCGLGVSAVTLPSGAEVWGMGGALFGSFTYAYGSRTGDHLLITNVTSDWGDPIALFTDMLTAEF